MRKATSAQRELARQLLAQEALGSENPGDWVAALESTCLKLYQHIALLLGPAGFHALLARALQIASSEFPFLRAVRTNPQAACRLEGLRESVAQAGAEEIGTALTGLLANFIWLLCTFIGDDFGLRLVRDAFPALGPSDGGADAREATS